MKFEILDEIEKTRSTLSKQKLLEDNITEDIEEFLRLSLNEEIYNVGERFILNAYKTTIPRTLKDIGEKIQWIIEKTKPSMTLLSYSGIEEDDNPITIEDFKEMLLDIKNLSGYEMQTRIKEFFDKCNPLEAKWYSRSLVKDLSFGMSAKSINKVFKKLGKEEIKIFEVSLAALIDCSSPDRMKNNLKEIFSGKEGIYMDGKYDGFRLIKRHDAAISRNGKTINTVNFLDNEIANSPLKGRQFELDGELIAKDFQSVMTTIHRKNDLSIVMPRKYMVFDITMLDGNDLTILSYFERKKILAQLFEDWNSDIIQMIDSFYITNINEAIKKYQQFVDEGLEGAVIKIPAAPYTRDRESWWKMKPVLTADMKVIGVQYGKGKNAGKISALTITDASGCVICNVGSGLKDNMINELDESCIGKIVEVRYDSLTKVQSTGERSLRFPRFICFRDDKEEPEVL